MFVSNLRPDVVFAVNSLARYLERLGEEHYQAALRIIPFLLTTRDCGLNIDKAEIKTFELSVESDSDCADDMETRRSILG